VAHLVLGRRKATADTPHIEGPAPLLGHHSEDMLQRQVAMSSDQIAVLQEQGIVY